MSTKRFPETRERGCLACGHENIFETFTHIFGYCEAWNAERFYCFNQPILAPTQIQKILRILNQRSMEEDGLKNDAHLQPNSLIIPVAPLPLAHNALQRAIENDCTLVRTIALFLQMIQDERWCKILHRHSRFYDQENQGVRNYQAPNQYQQEAERMRVFLAGRLRSGPVGV